tara:strand:+ start:349 stop:717 length:369 start_codon:yes stop_codon:yes gene_type:complete
MGNKSSNKGRRYMTVEYLAGLFDADGCASSYLQRNKKSNKTVQVHSCEISMTNKEVVHWVKDFLGFGNIFYKKKVGGMGKKPQWRYRASHRLALKFANKVLPHSIVKKKKLQDIVNHYVDKA